MTSHVTTRSKRHGPDPSEEQSRAKRPKQELSEEGQRVKRPKQEPSEEEACAIAAQLSHKRQKADSAQNDPPTANTTKDNRKVELAESFLQSDAAVQADSGNVHKLDAKSCSAAELNSDSNSGPESQSQGEQRHVQAVSCAASICWVAHETACRQCFCFARQGPCGVQHVRVCRSTIAVLLSEGTFVA